jgi:hypothetical protein
MLSTVALAGSMLNITSTTATDITKYNGDQNKLTYALTLTLPASAPTELFLNKIQSNGSVMSTSVEPTSSTCKFGLQAPALQPGNSCTVSYQADVPSLTDKSKSQVFKQSFQVLDGLGKTAASPDFKLTVLPDAPAPSTSTLVFQKNNTTVTAETTNAGTTENLTVKNTSDVAASGFSLSVPPTLDSIISGSCLSTTTLAAGATCSVVVSSLNSQADVTNNITADASNAIEPVNLGVVIQALSQLVFQTGTPASTVTQANVSETGTLNLTVKNTGDRTASLFAIDAGGLADAIQSSSTCPQDPAKGSLAAGATCTINLSFTGAGITPSSYAMRAFGENALPSTLNFTVSEQGHFTIKNDSDQIINNLSAAMSSANAAVNLTVENTGGSVITGMNVAAPNFSGDCTTPNRSLAAGASCTLTFTPSSLGVSMVHLIGNNADNNNLTFPVFVYNAWSATQGPVGAQMSAIIKVDSTLYAGVYDNGGVYKSTDNGQNWSHTGGQGIDHEIEAMKQIGTRIYAITLNNDVFVYNTADSTPAWTAMPAHGYAGRSLAVNGTTLYAGFGDTSGQVYQLTDGSTTWSQVGTGLPTAAFALAVKDNVLYAGTTGSGVYKYENGSWTQFGLAGSNVKALANVNGELYAAAGDQLYRYNTGTENWDTYGSTVGAGTIYDINIWMGHMIVGCESGVYKYSAGAWSKIGTTNIWGYHLLPDGSTLYAASISYAHHGIYKINDGDADWTEMNTGLYATAINDMAMADTGTIYTAGQIGVDQYAGSPTKTWSEVDPANEPYDIEGLYYGIGGVLYAGTRSGVESYSINAPSPAWAAVGADLDEDTDTMAEHDGDLYSGTDEGRVYAYSGSVWSQVGTDFLTKVVSLVDLFDHTQGKSVLYAAVYNDGVYKLSGSSWVAINAGLPSSKQLVGLLDKGNKLYVADNSGVYAYDESSSTWVEVAHSPTDVIGIGKNHDSLYALTDTGGSESVYRYSDSEAVWFKMNEGLPAGLYGKDIRGSNDMLYLDSNGLGVYQLSLN